MSQGRNTLGATGALAAYGKLKVTSGIWLTVWRASQAVGEKPPHVRGGHLLRYPEEATVFSLRPENATVADNP